MNLLRWIWFNVIYFKHPPWDTGISPPELLEFIETHQPGKAIDLGCGSGTNVITLAQQGWEVTGVDFSRRAINQAHQKAQQHQVNVRLIVCDVTKLQLNTEKFELILDIGCFHSLDPISRQKYIENVMRLLSPEGTFLLYAFVKAQTTRAPGITESEIKSLMTHFTLSKRVDGIERLVQPSLWLTFQHP